MSFLSLIHTTLVILRLSIQGQPQISFLDLRDILLLITSGLKRKLEGIPRAQQQGAKAQLDWEVESDGSSTVTNSLDSEFERIHDKVKQLSKEYEFRKRKVKKGKAFGRYKALRTNSVPWNVWPKNKVVVDEKAASLKACSSRLSAETAAGRVAKPDTPCMGS